MTPQEIADIIEKLPLDNVSLAITFIIYWIATVQRALLSAKAYFFRSLVIFVYGVCSCQDNRTFVTNAEWIANALVWFHWLGAVQTFFYPDPRFRRIK